MEWGHQMTAACTWGGSPGTHLVLNQEYKLARENHERSVRMIRKCHVSCTRRTHNTIPSQKKRGKSQADTLRGKCTLEPTEGNCFPACRTTDNTFERGYAPNEKEKTHEVVSWWDTKVFGGGVRLCMRVNTLVWVWGKAQRVALCQ